MLSTQKVHGALDQVEDLADADDAEPTVKAAAAILAMGRPYVNSMIPQDPRDLDELLRRGAEWMLGLCSDNGAGADQLGAHGD